MITSSTAFSRALSDRRSALISACASPSSLSLSKRTQKQRTLPYEIPKVSENPRSRSGNMSYATSHESNSPLTSFSSRLSSTLRGSDPCISVRSSSASRPTCAAPRRREEELLCADDAFPSSPPPSAIFRSEPRRRNPPSKSRETAGEHPSSEFAASVGLAGSGGNPSRGAGLEWGLRGVGRRAFASGSIVLLATVCLKTASSGEVFGDYLKRRVSVYTDCRD